MATEQKKKTGFGALFSAGKPSADYAYHIIYFTITSYITERGPEQYAILLYGDDNSSIFTITLPAGAILYSYREDVTYPTLKMTKSFMPGSTKAEIWLPVGFSFMAPSMPAVIPVIKEELVPAITEELVPKVVSAIPEQKVQYVPKSSSRQTIENIEDLPEPEMSTDDVIRLVNENEAKAKAEMEAREARGEVFDVEQFMPKPSVEGKAFVIPEDEQFGISLDSGSLNDKIEKFLSKNEPKVQVEHKPVTDLDPRTIEEVKRESVEDEMERLMKNDEAMEKLKNITGDNTNKSFDSYPKKR